MLVALSSSPGTKRQASGTIGWMDRSMLERFRAGDAEAVKTLYDEYGGAVFALSLSVLGDRDLAADSTQQTFLKAWKAAETFDADRDIAPWLYAIGRRTAIDIYRKRRREIVKDDVDVIAMPPSLDSAWEVFEVRAALDRLPDEERSIVKLSQLDGYTHSEIAEHLGIPIGTVKSRSHRAHQRLASMLQHLVET